LNFKCRSPYFKPIAGSELKLAKMADIGKWEILFEDVFLNESFFENSEKKK